MPASDRTVFGRAFKVTPLWMWILQRASGILLGPLVALHIWIPGLAGNRVLNALLLAIVLAHGYSGMRRMFVKEKKAAVAIAHTWAWFAIVAFFGALLVVWR